MALGGDPVVYADPSASITNEGVSDGSPLEADRICAERVPSRRAARRPSAFAADLRQLFTTEGGKGFIAAACPAQRGCGRLGLAVETPLEAQF